MNGLQSAGQSEAIAMYLNTFQTNESKAKKLRAMNGCFGICITGKGQHSSFIHKHYKEFEVFLNCKQVVWSGDLLDVHNNAVQKLHLLKPSKSGKII